MIKFNYIEWKNFLSQGDTPVRINLDKDHTTLIRGTNGAGKTTVVDAICYGLFNKPLRPVKLGQLVNTINKKKMLVTINFSVNGNNYEVRRGQKPTVFEILKEGEPLPQLAAAKDQQAYLEEVLGCNYKTFTQVVIIASTGYQNFMELTPVERRVVVEQMLDIEVIGKMAELAKQRKKDVQNKQAACEQNYSSTTQKIDSVKRLIDEVNRSNNNVVADLDGRIEAKNLELKQLKDSHEAQVNNKPDIDMDAAREDYNKASIKINDYREQVKALHGKKQSAQTEMFNEIEESTASLMKISWDRQQEIDSKITDNLIEQSERDKPFNQMETDFRMAISNIDKLSTDASEKKEYYSSHEECEVCGQHIDADFCKDKLNEAEAILSKNSSEIAELKTKAAITRDSRVKMNEEYDEINNALKAQQVEIREAAEAEKAKLSDDIKAKYADQANELNEQIRDLENCKIKECERVIDDVNLMAEEMKNWSSVCDSILQNARGCQEMIQSYTQQKLDQISQGQETVISYHKEVEELNEEIDDLIERRAEITEEMELVEMSLVMLKDNGLKAKIVKQYLPLVNRYINDYLDMMGANYSFELDEAFNETIKSRYRDNFSYASFSNGERARINLSILWMWRKLAESKNTVASNLLFIDEVLDSSLDKPGIENVFKIFESMPNSNMFIISHRPEIVDRFDNVITVSKLGNFASYDLGEN